MPQLDRLTLGRMDPLTQPEWTASVYRNPANGPTTVDQLEAVVLSGGGDVELRPRLRRRPARVPLRCAPVKLSGPWSSRSSTTTSGRPTPTWRRSGSSDVLPVMPVWQPILLGGIWQQRAGSRGRVTDERAGGHGRGRAAGRRVRAHAGPLARPLAGQLAQRHAGGHLRPAIGRAVAFSLAAFRQAFAGGRDLSEVDNVVIAAAACELHPNAVLKAIETQSVKDKLRGGHGRGVRARRAGRPDASPSATSSSAATTGSRRPLPPCRGVTSAACGAAARSSRFEDRGAEEHRSPPASAPVARLGLLAHPARRRAPVRNQARCHPIRGNGY